MQTVLNSLYTYVSRSSQPFSFQLLRILTQLCRSDKIASYEESIRIKLLAIRMFIPIWNLDKTVLMLLVEELKKVKFYF